MPKAVAHYAHFLVDNVPYVGRYEITHEINHDTFHGDVPDPSWSFVDGEGHFHACDSNNGEFITLNAENRRVPCDGSCNGVCGGEGYDHTFYTCKICAEEIEPGFHVVTRQVAVSDMRHWQATVDGPFIKPGKTVSVHICDVNGPGLNEARTRHFGIAVVTELDMDSETVTLTLAGTSELGTIGTTPQGAGKDD